MSKSASGSGGGGGGAHSAAFYDNWAYDGASLPPYEDATSQIPPPPLQGVSLSFHVLISIKRPLTIKLVVFSSSSRAFPDLLSLSCS